MSCLFCGGAGCHACTPLTPSAAWPGCTPTQAAWVRDGRYLVSPLGWGTVQTYNRLLLVQGGNWEQGDQPVACDSESPDGLAFYADDYEGEGEILWDSAAR